MPYQKVHFVKHCYYHVFNRGVNKQPIFFSRDNYIYLVKLIGKYLQRYHVAMIAYCLMPNHYHFLLRQDDENSISLFLQQTFKSYVQAVNKQQARVGALFQNRPRAVWVDDSDYLLYVCRYIHRNPVKANLVARPEDWEFSNYCDWVGLRKGRLLDRNFISDLFPDIQEYVAFVSSDDDNEQFKRCEKYYLD